MPVFWKVLLGLFLMLPPVAFLAGMAVGPVPRAPPPGPPLTGDSATRSPAAEHRAALAGEASGSPGPTRAPGPGRLAGPGRQVRGPTALVPGTARRDVGPVNGAAPSAPPTPERLRPLPSAAPTDQPTQATTDPGTTTPGDSTPGTPSPPPTDSPDSGDGWSPRPYSATPRPYAPDDSTVPDTPYSATPRPHAPDDPTVPDTGVPSPPVTDPPVTDPTTADPTAPDSTVSGSSGTGGDSGWPGADTGR